MQDTLMSIQIVPKTPSYESQIEELNESALSKRDIHITEEDFNNLTAQFV